MNSENAAISQLPYKKKRISDLNSGDILLHPIYRSDGLLLMAKDKELSPTIIDIIKRHTDISTPFLIVGNQNELKSISPSLKDNPAFIRDIEEITNDYNRRTSASTSVDSFLNDDYSLYESNSCPWYFAHILSRYPLWNKLGEIFEAEQLRNRTDHIKDEIIRYMTNDGTFIDLFTALKSYHDILYIHSINTACISIILGLANELVDNELIELACAALFSNVGFLDMPKDEFEAYLKGNNGDKEPISKHLELFSAMTINSPELRNRNIIYGILDHHEFYNGKGYPNGKQGAEISLYGRIIHIAASYDELVGGYRYTEGVSPIEAVRKIYEDRDNKFDKALLDAFIFRTNYLKLGSEIVLPSHETGIIVGFDNFAKAPHLPIIRMENGLEINLYKLRGTL